MGRLAPVTIVLAFHAHPDDEVLLTGGTISGLAAAGHRVIIVVACDGDMWPGPQQGPRLAELQRSAAILGAAKAVHLGYADSGHGPLLFTDPPGRTRFARAGVPEAAAKLAALLQGERADLLLSYDRQGGYGHRDHVRCIRSAPRRPGWPECGRWKRRCRASWSSWPCGRCCCRVC
jgi:LmbE family N-acetylglucosaminyl deacetylase